jgi:hypothetical protein
VTISRNVSCRRKQKGRKEGAKCVLFASSMVSMKRRNSFGINGGDDETRTRDLCRDRRSVNHWRTQNQQVSVAVVGNCWLPPDSSGAFCATPRNSTESSDDSPVCYPPTSRQQPNFRDVYRFRMVVGVRVCGFKGLLPCFQRIVDNGSSSCGLRYRAQIIRFELTGVRA